MKLYTFFRSSASFRVRIALNVKGIPYTPELVSLPKNEHAGSKYRSVNPAGLVPALEDAGRVLGQSLAIMEYLDEAHPGPKLLPSAPLDRAYVRAFAQMIACEIHPLNNTRTLKYVRHAYNQDDEGVNRWYRHWIHDGFMMLEAFLRAEGRYGKFVFGDQVTMADCALVPQVFNAQRFECDMAPYPVAMAIFADCMKLKAFVDAAPSNQPDAA